MTPDAIEALETVRAFLTEKILPAVPASLRSDVRAAAKLMENALGELDVLYPMLAAEGLAMEQLCREAAKACPGDGEIQRVAAAARDLAMYSPRDSLQALRTRHAAWRRLSGDLALALNATPGAAAAALLQRLLNSLGQDALVRTAWQSVFPDDKPFSGIMIST